jgi:hypothetical protein
MGKGGRNDPNIECKYEQKKKLKKKKNNSSPQTHFEEYMAGQKPK